MHSSTFGKGWVPECMSFGSFSLRELTCMRCVYLALWTRKVLCGSFFMRYIKIFIHSFIHRRNLAPVRLVASWWIGCNSDSHASDPQFRSRWHLHFVFPPPSQPLFFVIVSFVIIYISIFIIFCWHAATHRQIRKICSLIFSSHFVVENSFGASVPFLPFCFCIVYNYAFPYFVCQRRGGGGRLGFCLGRQWSWTAPAGDRIHGARAPVLFARGGGGG